MGKELMDSQLLRPLQTMQATVVLQAIRRQRFLMRAQEDLQEGMVREGMVREGMVREGMVREGMVQEGLVREGMV
jgi:hypothetical protein